MPKASFADPSDKLGDQFKEIAQRAAQRATSRIEKEAKRKEQLRLEYEARFASGVASLKDSVLPLLRQAGIAFQAERVPVEITENFVPGDSPHANVVFECCGPFLSDYFGSIDLVNSNRAIFFHNGTDFQVGLAKSYSSSVSDRVCIEGELEPAVLAAVEQVVESFFRAVEMRFRYSGRPEPKGTHTPTAQPSGYNRQ